MSKLYVLSGSSACGKTTLMNNALHKNPTLITVQKYGTRRRRPSNDGIEDDVCQVFDKPFPDVFRNEELLDMAEEFLLSLYEKKSDKYVLRKNTSKDNLSIFQNHTTELELFEKNKEITRHDVSKILGTILSPFYNFKDKQFKLKSDLSKDNRRKLSNLLESLQIRKSIISIGILNYWDDYGIQVDLKGCIDIAYALNKGQYGICTENIKFELKNNKNVITILSDFRVINRLKDIFKKDIVVIYIASAVDTAKLERIQIGRLGISEAKELVLCKKVDRLNSSIRIKKWESVARWIYELNLDWEKIKPDAESTAIRAERIKTFHTRYVDNITLFDYTILNYNEGHPEDMTMQFNNILNSEHVKNVNGESPLFVVVAASNAGKGTMMEMLNLIGSDRVQILSKIAKRKEKNNDKKDGMLPIGLPYEPPQKWPEWPRWWTEEMIYSAKQGQFPKEYDFSWCFHGGKVVYAVSDKEIQYNFNKNKAQIVVSNTDQIEEFINRYGERVIFVLLFRLSSINDTKTYYEMIEGLSYEEAEIRANEVRDVLQKYIEKIHFFNHVILNTTRPEDLYDQIFQLVEYYHVSGNNNLKQ